MPHHRKLAGYGFSGQMFCQLKGFLSANCQSQVPLWVGVLFMKSGVPRGLVIGPLLFTLIHLTSFRQTLVSLLMILKCILLSRHLRIPTSFRQTLTVFNHMFTSNITQNIFSSNATCITLHFSWFSLTTRRILEFGSVVT